MQYLIILGDGMADEPIESLGGKTPLAYADTPNMDRLAARAELGMVRTVPEGMSPGSDTANLSVLGYNPRKYYTGRSPLEALSIGAEMKDSDVALRCNLVTLTDGETAYADKKILDHSSGEITTGEAAKLIEAVRPVFENDTYRFFVGTSYRHLLLWSEGRVEELTPPHDILGKTIGEYLPEDPVLRDMMERSYEILDKHPVNIDRERRGLHKANSLWFWGAGTRPALDSFEEKNGKKGAMISAVDLLKGIAVGAGMTNISVEGADGSLHTNYEGKAQAAVRALLEEGHDFVYVHVEAPDEMGHQGSVENKVAAIEYLDQRLIGPACQALDASGEPYRMLIMPDHPTPIRVRTHVADPIPYLLYDSRKDVGCGLTYNEETAAGTGVTVDEGYRMVERLFEE